MALQQHIATLDALNLKEISGLKAALADAFKRIEGTDSCCKFLQELSELEGSIKHLREQYELEQQGDLEADVFAGYTEDVLQEARNLGLLSFFEKGIFTDIGC